MTMSYKIGVVETKPLAMRQKWNESEQRYEDDFSPIPTEVYWVSHGNYGIAQPLCDYDLREKKGSKLFPYNWLNIEAEYFDEILKALEEKPLPTTGHDLFVPFWQAILPPRGMHFFETYLRTYFFLSQRKSFIIHSQCSSFIGAPCPQIQEMGFTVEDFKKLRDMALGTDVKRPVHYCRMGW